MDQVEELRALDSMLPNGLCLSAVQQQNFDMAQKLADCSEELAADAFPQLSGKFQVGTYSVAGAPVMIRFTLPREYPLTQPSLVVEAQASRALHDRLQGACQRCCTDHAGDLCLLAALEYVKDEVEAMVAANEVSVGDTSGSPAASDAPNAAGQAHSITLAWRSIWFHHIMSATKKSLIMKWSRELRVGGLCKPGYPGALVLEGDKVDVDEFIRRLRSLTWKAMALRGEAELQVEASPIGRLCVIDLHRRLPHQVLMLDSKALSELGAQCRAAGLEEIFLSILKISKSGEGEQDNQLLK